MQYSKKELIAEGKTKLVWATENEKHIIVEFKDDAMTFHGKRKVYFEGKAKLSNQINAKLMTLLEENGIQTHFCQLYNDACSVVKRAEMIPVEVVVRNYTAGSICTRLGLEPQKKLKAPVLEFCYKNDKLGDPVINEYHAYAMELCTQEEMANMVYTVSRINKVLCDAMKKIGIIVADFKVEFGRINGRLVVADEITPTTARLWDATTLKRFGNDKDVSKEYTVINQKLQNEL